MAPTLPRSARGRSEGTWSGPLSNIFRVRGNCWEWGVYCTPAVPGPPGRPAGRSRPTGCLATSLVRLELLALDVGGEPLPLGKRTRCILPKREIPCPHAAHLVAPTDPDQEPNMSSLARHVPMPPDPSCQ